VAFGQRRQHGDIQVGQHTAQGALIAHGTASITHIEQDNSACAHVVLDALARRF